MPGNVLEPTAYVFGEFRLNKTVLRHRDVVVALPPKMLDTLYVLVSRAPEVVTKDEIMAKVWPDTFVVDSGLTRNISVIRKSLEDHGGAGEYIETIPKRGYRFVREVAADVMTVEAPPEVATQVASRPEAVKGTRWWTMFAAAAFVVLVGACAWWKTQTDNRPSNPDAAELIGRYLLYKVSPADARKALTSFEAAVAANPRSAGAHAGLAEVLLMLPLLAQLDYDAFRRAKTEAEVAVGLDERLSLAHSALGGARLVADWDFAGAEASLKRALALDGECLPALTHYAQLMNATARFDEAASALQRAVRRDPVSPLLGAQLGVVLYNQRRFEEAAKQFQSVLDREPAYALAHYYLALTQTFLGRYEDALGHLAKSELHPGVVRTDEAWIRLKRGDRTAAEQVYAELRRETDRGKLRASAPVLLAVWTGRVEEALTSIDAGLKHRDLELLALRSDPRLEPLRSHRRYEQAVQRLMAGGK